MAHFIGRVEGNQGPASRLGSLRSGLTTVAAGNHGAVSVRLFNEKGVDYFEIWLIPWQDSGGEAGLLASGVLDATDTEMKPYARRELPSSNPERNKT